MKYAYTVLILALVLSCAKERESSYTLIMKSPEACTHSIKIESNGRFVYGIEYPEDEKNSRFYRFDTLVSKDVFIKLEALTVGIKSHKKKVLDAFYYQLLKNDEKIGESFARKSHEMNVIKDYLVTVLPFKVDYFCTKFITGEYGLPHETTVKKLER